MAQQRWRNFLLGTAAVALGIQLVPYGHSHTNPPATQEPAWDSAITRALAVRACFACHSNSTAWPWYSRVAPASWLVQHDVDEGREHLNFTEWSRPQEHAKDAADVVRRNMMPPALYLLMHPEARLSPAAFEQLADGLQKSVGTPLPSH